VLHGLLDQIWILSMQADVRSVYECIQALTGYNWGEELRCEKAFVCNRRNR